jgi:hypothetical protein
MNVLIAALIGFAILLALTGCARAPVEDRPNPVEAKPAPAPAKPEEAVAAKTAGTPPAAGEAVPVAPAAPPAAEAAAKAPEASTAPAKPVAKAPAQPQPAPKKEVAATVPAKPAPPPPLDLDSLERRLKDTDAIGIMTKLTLKNQVSDLLGQFEGLYGGTIKTTLTELRQPYDLLILKVLSLLQDRDPPLAHDILASREAIWGILSDRDKFQNVVNKSGG